MILYNKHIEEYKSIISEITDELNVIRRTSMQKRLPVILAIYNNNKNIKDNLNQLKPLRELNTSELNKFYYLITRELVFLGGKSNIQDAYILQKKVEFNKIRQHNRGLSVEAPKIKELINHIITTKSVYEIEDPKSLIVVAVPNEFRAIYKKLNVIKGVELTNETKDAKGEYTQDFYDILQPENDKFKRKYDFVVNAIITRNGKDVCVTVVLLKEYGSFNSLDTTKLLLNEYTSIQEVNLIGIAGQMSKSDDIKIGHLIVSNGFYNSHPKKLEEKINYKNTNLIPIINKIQDNDNWTPKYLLEKCPIDVCTKTESTVPNVKVGYFVSGTEVVKNSSEKQNILNHFKDCSAVEMELFGCYKACLEYENVEVQMFKAICDWSNEEKNKKWQPYCSDLAAEFTVEYLIEKYGK